MNVRNIMSALTLFFIIASLGVIMIVVGIKISGKFMLFLTIPGILLFLFGGYGVFTALL